MIAAVLHDRERSTIKNGAGGETFSAVLIF